MFVLDTDVVVAALRSPAGASAALVAMAIEGELPIAASVAMILEYEAVCVRDEHPAAAGLLREDALVVIDALADAVTQVRTHFQWRPQLRDAGDEMVLEAAVNGGASAIVTFNRRDFRMAAARFALDLLRPGELLRRLK